MKIKRWYVVLYSMLLTLSVSTNAQDFLSGNEKYACEAILCLSSGQRPSECDPSLEKYFSIKSKKPSKTIKKRKNFLEQCPDNKYEGKDAHLSAIAAGAGRCDMASLLNYLNAENNNSNPFGPNGLLSNQQRMIPAYCNALFDNQYTDGYQLPVQTQSCSQVATPFGYTNKCRTIWVDPSTLQTDATLMN